MSTPTEPFAAVDATDPWSPPEPRRSRGGLVGVLLLAVLTAGALVFGALSYVHWKDLRDTDDARLAAKTAASDAIPKFTSFDYHELQKDITRAKSVLTTCFGTKYAATLQQAVPQATQAQAVVTDTVIAAQVLDLKGDLAHVQVFFDQKAQFGDGRPSKVTPYRVVLDMVKQGGRWKVNYLDLDDAGASAKRPCG